MSTTKEVAQGRVENQAIDRQSVILHDPFLTSWVNRIGSSLAQHRIRRDITYTFTVIDDQSINAFAIKGGFVHVNAGLLNFVSSDDELAATLGHEMGHVELHHVTKADNANTILGVLASIASMISIPTAILGGIGAGMATEKYSRIDELQADKYGLSIMGQAGYDPQAAVDVMRKLGTLDPGPQSRAEKAFLDHPVPGDRVAHLLGYRQLDRPSQADVMARAQHDIMEGRYSYARGSLRDLAQADQMGVSATALQSLDFALRESGPLASPESRSWAPAIPQSDPRRIAAAAAIHAAQLHQAAALQATKAMSSVGEMELNDLENRLGSSQALAAAAQPSGGAQPARSSAPGSSGPVPIADTLARDLNDLANLTGDVFSSAPGIAAQERQPLSDMLGPLDDKEPLTPKYAALLPYYPAMTDQLEFSSAGGTDAVMRARSAIAQVSLAFVRFNAAAAAQADKPDARPAQPSSGRLRPAQTALTRFVADVAAATAAASEASNELYASQAAALSTQISMLDLFSSPQRYEAYRAAIAYRFPGVNPPAYQQALALRMSSGELGCAAWLAFETGHSLTEVAANMHKTGRSCQTMSASDQLSAESMEIAQGLIYEDYDDAPTSAPQ
jgi:peptidase M48-like protein